MIENRGLRRAGLILCLFWLFVAAFPLYWVVITAFKPPLAVSGGATYLPFIDFQPTLQAFRDAFAGLRGDFWGPIVSSTLIALVATALSVFLGTMAAYALVRFTFRIRLLAGIVFAVISRRVRAPGCLHGAQVPMCCESLLVVALRVGLLNGRGAVPCWQRRNVTFSLFFRVPADLVPPIVSASDYAVRRDGNRRPAVSCQRFAAWS